MINISPLRRTAPAIAALMVMGTLIVATPIAYAQSSNANDNYSEPDGTTTTEVAPPVKKLQETSTDQASGSTVKLDDPLKTGGDIRVVFGRIIQLMTGISGSIALAAFVWGGFQMLIADGDSSKIEKGKNTLKYATFGLIMIFGAYVALRAVYGVLGV